MEENENTPQLLSPQEAADSVGLSIRMVQYLGQKWESVARETGDACLPSSPTNGLRRARLCSRRHRYDQRDIVEYVENATRETIGHSLAAWRKAEYNG